MLSALAAVVTEQLVAEQALFAGSVQPGADWAPRLELFQPCLLIPAGGLSVSFTVLDADAAESSISLVLGLCNAAQQLQQQPDSRAPGAEASSTGIAVWCKPQTWLLLPGVLVAVSKLSRHGVAYLSSGLCRSLSFFARQQLGGESSSTQQQVRSSIALWLARSAVADTRCGQGAGRAADWRQCRVYAGTKLGKQQPQVGAAQLSAVAQACRQLRGQHRHSVQLLPGRWPSRCCTG